MSATYTPYQEIIIPEPWRVLGIRLKPLSLLHFFLMARFKCAFVSEDETAATMEDLVLGVLICSRHWADEDEFLTFIESRTGKKQLKEWGEKSFGLDFNEKAKLFLDYIKEGSQVPRYWELEDSATSGGHWTQALLICAVSQLGYDRASALKTPLRGLLHDYFKHAETQGLIRLMTPDEIELIDAQTTQEQPI